MDIDLTALSGDELDARDGDEPAETAEALADVGAWPAWVQPTGAHDAYPVGRVVAHDGALWRSTLGGNVWEPGSTGAGDLWEKVTAKDAGEAPSTPRPGVEGASSCVCSLFGSSV